MYSASKSSNLAAPSVSAANAMSTYNIPLRRALWDIFSQCTEEAFLSLAAYNKEVGLGIQAATSRIVSRILRDAEASGNSSSGSVLNQDAIKSELTESEFFLYRSRGAGRGGP